MMKMKANYHTHTYRCHHAYGCEWEYVEEAIRCGLKTLGFADHAPHCYPEEYKSTRMLTHQLAEYVGTVTKLKKVYGDRIEILCGLEMEYYPAIFEQDLELFRNTPGLDYMILGQHYCFNEYDTDYHVSRKTTVDQEDLITQYVNQVIEAMKTERFLYIAHPDVVIYQGDMDHYRKEMRRLCKAAHEWKIPLELNMSGFRRNSHYPSRDFWKIAGEEQCLAVVGSDAHRPELTCVQKDYEGILDFAKEFGVEVLETLPMKEDFLK